MVVAEDAVPVGEHLPAELLGLGVAALGAEHPGHILAGDEGVGVAGAQDALPVGEQAPVLLLGVGVAALQLGRPG